MRRPLTRAIGRTPARLAALIALALLLAPVAAQSEPAPASDEPRAPAPEASPAAPAQGAAALPARPAVSQGAIYAPNLAVITIEGMITALTSQTFERRLNRAVDSGADAIVIDLDTPGGVVGSVLEICNLIKGASIPTVAWVNPNAYSGGAIIALACDEIVLSSTATMGDAAPVALDPIRGISKIEDPEIRQKQLAPILTEIVDSARRNGYDEVLVQSLVSLGVETWHVRDDRTGESHFLTEIEYEQLFGEPPTRGTPTVASGTTAPPEPAGDEALPEGLRRGPGPNGFRPASPLFGQELADTVDTNVGAASSRPDFAAEDPANFTLVGYATDGQTLLTMKTRELRAFGFTDPAFNIDDDQDLKTFFGAQNLARLDQTWSENLVGFMTQGMSGIIIRGLLIVVFLLAMFIEMSAPGVGVAGAIGLAALGGIIIPPLLVGASTWWALAAILLGFALILLEVLVIPGFGVPGLAGLAALMVGLVGSFAGTGEIFPGAGGSGGSSLAWAVSTVILATFAAGTAMYFVSKYTRSIPIANRLVLADVQKASPPVGEADSGTLLGAMAGAPVGPVAVGDVGITTTRLIPAGSAEFGGRLLDVVSELGYVEPGTRIRVVNVTEYRIGVEPMSEDGAAEAGGPPETHA